MIVSLWAEAKPLAFPLQWFPIAPHFDPDSCRPFDSSRAGLNLGEGGRLCGVGARKPVLWHAVSNLFATLSGWGNACDAFHQTASSEEGIGANPSHASRSPQAGLQPADIGYINAHGTGTPNNDASELAAVRSVFPTLPLSSTKSATDTPRVLREVWKL